MIFTLAITEMQKSTTSSIVDSDKMVQNISYNVNKNGKRKKMSIHQPQIESNLLPIHEFEKLNKDFQKFKSKRNTTKVPENQMAAKSRQKSELLYKNKTNKANEFDDATSQITIEASGDFASLSLHKMKVSLPKVYSDNQKTSLKASNNSNALNTDKGNTSDMMKSIGNSKNSNVVEPDDEVNYLLMEEDPMLEK